MQASHINIVANDADIRSDGAPWKPIWLHETELGHDKALSVNKGRAEAAAFCNEGEIPLIIFIGDGVSDLTAAREADILFARKGLKLEDYCKQNQIPYIPFETFGDVKKEVRAILQEDLEKTGGTGVPARFNPRANMWRRISSKQTVCSACSISLRMRGANVLRCRNSRLLLLPTRKRCSCGPRPFPIISPRRMVPSEILSS